MVSLDSFPGPSGAADANEAGKDLAGLVVKSAAGVPRAGVFPRGTGSLITGRSDLKVDVGIFESVLVRNGAVRFSGNDASIAVPASPLTAPVANTKYAIFYQKQNETAAGDAGNTSVIDAVQGNANSNLATALADARAALALIDGAVELGYVALTPGATATNTLTITQTAPFTAAAGGVVWLRNQAEEDAWVPADGSTGFRMDTQRLICRRNGTWRPVPLGSLLAEWHINVAAGSGGGQPLGPSAAPTLVIPAAPYARAIRVTVQGGVFLSAPGDGGVSVVPSTGAWAGATNSHRVWGTTSVFSDLAYVFYMASLPAATSLTLTLSTASSVNAGYDIHFRVEEA